MPKFSKRSLDNLNSAEDKLQILFKEVIKDYDCIVIYGHRTPEEQMELFQKGRKRIDGWWQVVDKSKVVTNLDGSVKKSKHNYFPSKAVDVLPYPIDWNDIQRFKDLAKVVKQKAKELGIEVEWGGDWTSLKDYPHWQVK